MAFSALQQAVSSVSRTRKLAVTAAAMLVSGALILTGFGATSANAVAAPKTTLQLHLTSSTGAPVKDAEVLFFPESAGDVSLFSILLGVRNYVPAVPVPGKPGTYTADFSAHGAGSYTAYLESAGQDGTAAQYLGGAQTSADAQYLDIHAGANAVNISFAASGTISGTVKTTAGKVASDVCVELYAWDGSKWIAQSTVLGLLQCVGAINPKTGHYSVKPGAAGSYKVQFVSIGGAHVTQFSDGSTDVDSAPAVYLAAGQSAVVNGSLPAAGKFTGTLLTPASKPFTNAEVFATELRGNPVDGFTAVEPPLSLFSSPVAGYDITGKTGTFSLDGIHTGYYSIGYMDFSSADDSPAVRYIGGDDAEHSTVFSGVTGKTVKLGSVHTTAVAAGPTASIVVTLTGTAIPADPTDGVGFISPTGAAQSRPEYDAQHKTLTFTNVPQGTDRLIAFDAAALSGGEDDDGNPVEAPDASFLPSEQDVVIGPGINTATIDFSPVTDLAFTTDPTLSTDTPALGVPLTVTTGVANHALPDSTTSYQWYRSLDGSLTPIFAAKTASYTPRGADAGAHLYVKVTNTFTLGISGFSFFTQKVSSTLATDAVPAGAQITSVVAPQIAGGEAAAAVGTTVTATGSTWSVTHPHLSYQWQRNGDVIPGAVSPSYTLGSADFGADVSVLVTASKAGYPDSAPATSNTTSGVTGAAPTTITAPKIAELAKPVLSEGPTVHTFTITPGTWTADDVNVTYVWTADDASGTPVTGTGSVFSTTTTGAVSVIATASSNAREPGTWTGVAQRGTVASPFTAISDSTTPGSFAYTLGVSGSAIAYQQHSASEKTSGTFQRLVGKKWVSFASKTGATYVTTVKDIGAKFRYVSTFTSPLYATVVSTTAPFTVTPRTGLTDNASVTVAGPLTIGGTVTAQLDGFAVAGTKHTYQWQSSSDAGATWKKISKATASKLLLASPLAAGTQVRVALGSTASGFASATIYSNAVTLLAGPTVIGSVTAPTITPGDVRAGRTATASAGSWDVAGIKVTYQWQLDGEPVVGATGKTFATAASEAGSSLTVVAIAHRTGYTDSTGVTSAAVTIRDSEAGSVHSAPFSLGSVKYGSTVGATDPKAIFGLDDDASGFTTTYQWKLSGKSIAGATGATYAPTISQIGKKLSVVVTLHSDVYGTHVASSSASTVTLGDPLPLLAGVSSSATPAVAGTVLTAQTLTFASLALKYQWQWSSNGSAWAPVTGATSSTYTIAASGAGIDFRVEVTGTKSGYAPAIAHSDTVSVQSSGTLVSVVDPTVASPKVGVVTSANPGSWSFAGASYAYQWLLDGTVIPGATSATFTPAPKFAGRELSVRVTASRAGYVSGTATSDSETIALGSAATATVAPKATGTCSTFAVTSGSWNVSNITETYQWTIAGAPVPDATSTTFNPNGATGAVAVVITVASPGYATTVLTLQPAVACI